jgi:2-(3-amino-3-carboxypropyl)histidine synthase
MFLASQMDGLCRSNLIMAALESLPSSSNAPKPRKRFVGKTTRGSKSVSTGLAAHQIPEDILNDPLLNQAIQQLPSNYSFEIHKTVHHVRKNQATMVALQMPEGLQMFACTIADIIERWEPIRKVNAFY